VWALAHAALLWQVRAGLVTFVTMAYILVVNPQVLSNSDSKTSGHMPFASIATATALSSAIASFMVGVFGNLPFGLAPGMGLNSYFAYGVCLRLGVSWEVALVSVFFQGVLFMILSLSGTCTLIQA
jgi:AGZA family xanthine/uracil permease-like MFS transporter